MSLRVVMIALLLLTAAALGLLAFQIGITTRTVNSASPGAKIAGPPVPASPAPTTTSYLVAAHPLPAGTLARSEDFASRSVPLSQLPPDAVRDTVDARLDLRGSLVRRFLETGTPLRAGDVTRPRERGFLSAVLSPGTRAVSIGVDLVSGVSGLIWPGDRVDVLLTQEQPPVPPESRRLVISETILMDARVLSVDQDLTQGPPVSGNAGRLAATITLEVVANQAEKLAVSARLGSLSLAVRPVADPNQPVLVTPGGASGADVSRATAQPAGTVTRMRVIQGGQTNEIHFR